MKCARSNTKPLQPFVSRHAYICSKLTIHDPCVQHISHQQSHCGGTYLPDCLPFFCALFFFRFLQSSPLFSLLFQSSGFDYFRTRCELCMMAFTQACHWAILGEMICINDGWQWRGDDEKKENDVRQKERRSCQEKCGGWVPDHGSNEAHPTFYLLANYQLFICPSGFYHAWVRSLSGLAHIYWVNLN